MYIAYVFLDKILNKSIPINCVIIFGIPTIVGNNQVIIQTVKIVLENVR